MKKILATLLLAGIACFAQAKETITIQDVEVTNLTDANLEVMIRTSEKLTKLSIKTYPSL